MSDERLIKILKDQRLGIVEEVDKIKTRITNAQRKIVHWVVLVEAKEKMILWINGVIQETEANIDVGDEQEPD